MDEEIVIEESNETDAEARLMGWVPKEEFKGKEDHWIDSETFVNRGKQILPIVKKNNEELTRKLLALEAKDRERDSAIAEWKKFIQGSQQREREEFVAQIATLRAQKKQAISDGDGDAVLEIDDAIDAIKDKQKEVKEYTPPKPDNQPDPAFIAWASEHSWYGMDEDKTAYANGIGPAVKSAHPHLVGKDFLDMVAARVEAKFPTKARQVSSVEGSNSPVASKKGKYSYNNLPEDAKKSHDKFVKQKLMTSEEYLASYFEG